MTIPSLTDFIWYEPEFIDLAFCDEIVKHSEEFATFEKGGITNARLFDDTVRNVHMTGVGQWPEIDGKLYKIFGRAMQTYVSKHADLAVKGDEGYTLLRYGPGQHYSEHVDNCTDRPRQVTAILGLNSEYTGGEFRFWGGSWEKTIEKGALLMFPSSFQYPHGVQPVREGTRYSIITWFF